MSHDTDLSQGQPLTHKLAGSAVVDRLSTAMVLSMLVADQHSNDTARPL